MDYIYLDNAATSFPKPESVLVEVADIMRTRGGNPGRGSHRLSIEASRVIFSTREALAKLLNARDATRIAFTKNATEAINIVLKGLLQSGDHVVTSAFEHNSVARPLKALEGRGVEVSYLKGDTPGFVTPKEVLGALRENTKLVTIVHGSNVFGTIQPIAEIGAVLKDKDVVFMTDAAQTVGALNVDVVEMNVDVLVGTGHKALFGPQGTGFLFVREGLSVPPLIDGGTGEVDEAILMPDVYEGGTMNTPGIGGLGAGINFVTETGIEKIRAHEVSLLRRLISGLSEIDGVSIIGPMEAEERVALLCFNIDGHDPQEVGVTLDEKYALLTRSGIHCSPGAHRTAGSFPLGAIRVSPAYFNTEEEMDTFINAVKEISKGGI